MYRIIGKKAVSIPVPVGTMPDGTVRERFEVKLPGAALQDSEISPRIIKQYEAGDLHTLSFLSKVKSSEEVDEETDETPDSEKTINEGGDQPVGVETGNPNDAHPAGATVPSTDEKEDYDKYTVEVLTEKIGGRGLTIPTGAKKADLVKILEDDDAKKSPDSNPFTNAA